MARIGSSCYGRPIPSWSVWPMIVAAIGIRSRNGDRVLTRVFELGDSYGYTAELAHEVVTIALTAASQPVVFDAAGTIWRVPRRRLAFVAVWWGGRRGRPVRQIISGSGSGCHLSAAFDGLVPCQIPLLQQVVEVHLVSGVMGQSVPSVRSIPSAQNRSPPSLGDRVLSPGAY